MQRKRERVEEESLCSSLGFMCLTRRNDVSLESSFKKLCLNDMVPTQAIKTQKKTTSPRKTCSVRIKPSMEGLKDAASSDAAKKCVVGVPLVKDCSLSGKEDGSQSTCQRHTGPVHDM